MKEKYQLTISIHKGTCSSAHLGHNRRTIPVPHANKSRQYLNVAYIDMSLEEAYHILFDDALKQYNSTKIPSRRIDNYLKHITEQYEKGEQKLQEAKSRGASRAELARIKSRYPKPFYELIVAVGNCDVYNGSFKCGRGNEYIAVDILNEYMKDFQKRNPNLFVFSANLHRDEQGVPHVHIDYIPWTNEPGRGLPVRISENGAFKQQGLTSGQRGDIGSIAFQEKERVELENIMKKRQISTIKGKHTKKHRSKEQYILDQQKEEVKSDRIVIENQAGEVIQHQDELVKFIRTNGIEEAFVEHIENIALRQDKEELDRIKQKNKKVLADAWREYNEYTADFFAVYKANKNALWEEIQRARRTSQLNKKRLEDLIFDITEGSDLLIIKLFKLFVALFVAIDNIKYDNELEKLQKANQELKQQAREVMAQSNDVSKVLRGKNLEDIEKAMKKYDEALGRAMEYVKSAVNMLGVKEKTSRNR